MRCPVSLGVRQSDGRLFIPIGGRRLKSRPESVLCWVLHVSCELLHGRRKPRTAEEQATLELQRKGIQYG